MNELIRMVNRKFAQKRERNRAEMQRRKAEIYAKIPRIKAIDKEMSLHSRDILSFVISRTDAIDDGIAEMERVSRMLKAEKAHILLSEGFAEDYLEPIYDCKDCQDRGYLESNERCQCFQQALLKLAYQSSSLEKKLLTENFDYFNIELFSDVPDDLRGISPRENMISIYNEMHKFTSNFKENNGDNYIFYGMTGRGKTFILTSVAKDLIDAGYNVAYQTAYELFRTAEINTFGKETSQAEKLRYHLIFDADLLLIDDLGTEMVNNFTQMELFNIINSRLLKEKKTIISTNLEPKELGEIYGERLASRFIGHYHFIEFFGDDIRVQS